jgi:CelD/BcsL family acetyltransferase involved in cellulose biosynthesis
MTCKIAEDHGSPLLAVGRSAGQVVGVLPLVRIGRDLRLLRSQHSPRCDFFGPPQALASVWRAIQSENGWNRLTLANIPATSALATELPTLARQAGCIVRLVPGHAVPWFFLQGFEERMNPKFRTNIRRCARKAGELTLERFSHPSRGDFNEAVDIEAMAWKGASGTAIKRDPSLYKFYFGLLHLFGRKGRASLNFVSANGKRIASLIALEDDHTLYATKIGYDQNYSNLSPGHLMIFLTAQDAERRGLRVLDFLGRDAEWKKKWTEQTRPHVSLIVYRKSLLGYGEYALREVVKPRLPASTVRRLKELTSAVRQFRSKL